MTDSKAADGKSDDAKGTTDAGSAGKSDDKAGSDADTKKQLELLQGKVDELVEDRNTWKSKFKALEKSNSDAAKKKAEDDGDVEAIKKSYDVEITKRDGQIQSLTALLHKNIAEGALRQAASGKVLNIDQIVGLLGHRITVHEENGETFAAIKNAKGDGIEYEAGKPLSVAKFLDDYLAKDENKNLAVSMRKSGSGATGTNSSGASDKVPTFEELKAMPDGGAAWIQANPKTAAKIAIPIKLQN